MAEPADQKDFDPVALLVEAWGFVKPHFAAFAMATVAFAIVLLATGFASGVAVRILSFLSFLPLVGVILTLAQAALMGLVTGPLHLGLFLMARAAVDRRPVFWNDVFSGFDKATLAAPAGAMIGMLASLGTMVFVLPGLFLVLIWLTTYLFIIEGKSAFWIAMEDSRRLVMANLMHWALLFAVLMICNLIGSLLCGIGLLITVPLSVIAVTLYFDQQRKGRRPPEAVVVEAGDSASL